LLPQEQPGTIQQPCEDFWSHGVAAKRTVLVKFFDQHHRQGLSSRRTGIEALFHPATLEAHSL
jgi:4,5-dihydroxyphthalate decarboxylase